jgi:glycosyltransferase involved in cell wall biosynthesis
MVNVISTFAQRTFVAQGFPASRLILTPLAVDVEEVVGAEARLTRAGPLRVLFLGNVSLQKGVHYLLEATRSLGKNAVNLSLIGGASSDGKEVLRRLARNGEWKGSVPRERLRQVFAEHDVLVLPSVQDGFGAVICEAMAAGLPVIATENTGAPDVVRDGVDGLIVPARSATALRDALETLVVNRPHCVAMGEAAAAAMARARTWDQFADDMLSRYAVAAKSGRTPRRAN